MQFNVHFNYQVEGTTTVEAASAEEAEEQVQDMYNDSLLFDEPNVNYWDFSILDTEETEDA